MEKASNKYVIECEEHVTGWIHSFYEVDAGTEEEALGYVLEDNPDHVELVRDFMDRTERVPGVNCKIFNGRKLLWYCKDGIGYTVRDEDESTSSENQLCHQ